ncbi:APC family permease [Syntrophorhabdus aromaticivorans]|uniref:APC family permease n=1 Tax=Syntrophorhabdus aromaticivorans TaxID=328301 RepID=A0A971RZK7_9BACT|nr:APC family permease [Syntrophorhabdus aromaticivorans]NLW34370.1 APC family permease [Syntrophorhabdus aromaticivorans]
MDQDAPERPPTLLHRIAHKLIGAPRDIHEPSLFHKLSLIPLLAWIGLGADGLSSSSYGPEEAFKALGGHTYIAILVGLATALTVFIISYAYSRIIEHFPHGGGGYIVATHTINENVGVVSGCALLVDYMLTITVSLVSCGDALFSFLPLSFQKYKLFFVAFLIVTLVILNLRGVKESVTSLAPIFIIFVVTHVLMIGYGILSHIPQMKPLLIEFQGSAGQDISSIGYLGILAIFLRAFSLGGGTYTGLEAVSNGMQIMREPKVHTGKRTMTYMATSLALTAGGLFFCYFLFRIQPAEGRTLNAILADGVFGGWPLGGLIALITILSEGALLIVGAQAGFIDGPRVMANMAIDSWFPRRFAALSERLSMQNGVLVMGMAALALLVYTHGSVSALIVMYSINVFVTFSLSQFGMVRFFTKNRERDKDWRKHIVVHVIGMILCLTILVITIYEKFREGGWITLFITSLVVGLCYLIRTHYMKVRKGIRQLEEMLSNVPTTEPFNNEPVNPNNMTAILLVSGFNGFGLHTLLSIVRYFPNIYKNFIFVSVAEVDSGSFKGVAEMEALQENARHNLMKYVRVTRQHGFPADYRTDVGTDVVEGATKLVESVVKEFPRSTVFTGKLVFKHENPFQRILHNETAYAIQRHLQWDGIPSVILPIRVNI